MTKRLITDHCSLFTLILLLLFIPLSAGAWNRSTPNVPPDSPLYRDLDKLIAFGLVHPPIKGQRPYQRSEFARLTAEAMEKYNKQVEVEAEVEGDETLKKFVKRRSRERQIEIVLGHLKDEFREDLVDMGAIEGDKKEFRVHPVHDLILYATYLDSPATAIPRQNGRGTIDALVNPLGDYDLGRHAIDGFQNAIEWTGWFEATKFISGYVRPRFEVNLPSDGGDMTGEALLQNAYATFTAGTFSLEFGRDSMVWGQGERGSLHFSTNPRPLDGVRITNTKPGRLPWVFKYLGEWRYTLYGYNLGPEQEKKWPWIAGYKFSLMPVKYIEFGFGHTVEMGGEGTPSLSAWEIMGEFTGFRPAGTDPTSPNKTNHMFEIDLLASIPPAAGLELYGNMSVDDYWKSIKKTLTQGCSYLAGLYLPAINPSGSADLRVEFTWVNPLHYRHSLYPNGYTENQKLIGTDAGPDAYNLHTLFRHTLSKKLWYGLSLDYDHRRSDTYTELRNPDGTAGPIVKIGTGPAESRYRGVANLEYEFKGENKLYLAVGYERVLNSQFQAGVDRNNFLLGANLTLDLDRFFAFAAN